MIGSWNCFRHWTQLSASISTGNNYCGTGRASAGDTAQEKGPRLVLSIFCLLILLFISGDVELNPGPTLNDKPTEDELVELLSSSKFTAGTWEQFACYLPNMTQDIITGIKERGSIEEDTMSAVAQHCLDNNPDITWKSIVHTLLATGEAVIAHLILEEKIIKSNKGAGRTVARVLRSHYSQLGHATESSLQEIADELYSKGLITRIVRKEPKLEKIEVEFLAIVEMYIKEKNIAMLREHCLTFLQCIASVGGPAKKEALALARDWDNEALKCNEISFYMHQSLTTTSSYDIIFSINLESEENIATELDNLNDEFAVLLTKIKEFYDTSEQHNVISIARFVEDRFDGLDSLAHENTKIDDIFRKLKEKSYFNLLDIKSIKKILIAFPIDDALQIRFEDYANDVERFVHSANVSDLKNKAIAAFEQKETAFNKSKLILKLSQKWSKQSINNLRKLMQHFFGEKADSLTYDDSFGGSIIIYFGISSEKDVHLLVQMANSQAVFMHHFGILQLIINNTRITDNVEDVNFKFEQSLIDAISNVYNDKEYHKIVLFLLQLDIDINYQNKHGSTALMSASANGHHQVVELLLSKDPDINIQNNEGWTALIAASQYGHHQVVELLLSKDPDINIQNSNGETALILASANQYHQVVDLICSDLLSKDPDIDTNPMSYLCLSLQETGGDQIFLPDSNQMSYSLCNTDTNQLVANQMPVPFFPHLKSKSFFDRQMAYCSVPIPDSAAYSRKKSLIVHGTYQGQHTLDIQNQQLVVFPVSDGSAIYSSRSTTRSIGSNRSSRSSRLDF